MKKISSEYVVGVGDINYGGHMGNDKALIVFSDARINFLKHFGFSELNIGPSIGAILAEANVKYKKEVFMHDVLETEVWISEVAGLKWIISYETKRVEDGAVVFTGTTLMLCYNYEIKKVSRIPEDFLSKVS
ncbi:MAG: thioesterase family protein [Flavobacteriales bacterium]|nr:thioesterase family protein [Flavobacteriales bacterium]